MVVPPMERFSGSPALKTSVCRVSRVSRHNSPPPPNTLSILAFEVAKTMSRLLSLYRSLSDDEIFKLRKDTMRSPGVSYLNSKDEAYLLNLACLERLDELDKAASAVTRFGRKCVDVGLNKFDQVYGDLKDGMVDLWKIQYRSKEIDRVLSKMKKFVSATSSLYAAMESLSLAEASEHKLLAWNNSTGGAGSQKYEFDFLDQKIAWQRKQVRALKEISLWNQTFDKSVSLMARLVCIVYARICDLFGPYIPVLPRMSSKQIFRVHLLDEDLPRTKSGPIHKTLQSGVVHYYKPESKLYCPEQIGFAGMGRKQDRHSSFDRRSRSVSLEAPPPATLGGSGLAARYASIVILAERYLHAPSIPEAARQDLYQMLPDSLRMSLGEKLRRLREEEEPLAEGWYVAVMEILRWLAPMAHDTVKWQVERNPEGQRFDGKSSVLLLQTLHYSDLGKADEAIAEVLAGLSYIYQYRASVGEWYI